MPCRLIREDILSSDRVDALDWAAEVFYRRLMSKVDDYGLFDARPSMLRTQLYPLRVDRVREADIARWIATCEKAGLIALYENGGKPYLQMLRTKWQTRSEPKYPLPSWGKGEPPLVAENNCSQPQTVAHLVGDVVEVEDVSTPANPAGTSVLADRFNRFWAAYPKKKGKGSAEKWWTAHKPTEELLLAMLKAISWQTKTEEWTKSGGQFIPYPASWLNDKGWEDEPQTTVNSHPVVHTPVITAEWWKSNAGIEAKARELGIDQGADQWPVFKRKVIEAAKSRENMQ